MKENQSFRSINTIRGIACLSVILFHYFSNYINGYGSNLISYGGSIGVSMFFTLSGFLIPYSLLSKNFKLNNTKQFLKKRFYRLYPTFFFGLIFTQVFFIVSGEIFSFYPNQHFSQTNFISDMFFLTWLFKKASWVNIVHWTIDIEIQYYIFSLLLISIFNRFYKKRILSLILITLIIYGIQHFLLSHSYLKWHTLFRWFPMFSLGILLCIFNLDKHKKTTAIIISLTFITGILYVFKTQEALGAILAFILLLFNNKIYSKTLDRIGEISYSLYLIHIPILSLIKRYLDYLDYNSLNKVIAFPFVLVIIIGVAYLMYKYIEKPTMLYASKIRYVKMKKSV